MGRMDDRVCLLTGAGSGIGRACAGALAAEGAVVIVTDRDPRAAARTVAEITGQGGRAFPETLDVADEDAWARVRDLVLPRWGPVHALVNCAAVYVIRDLADTTVPDWDRVFAVNVRGTFLGMRCWAPEMAVRGDGSVVNMSSVAGLRGAPGHALYGASKGAVRQMTKDVAAEFASAGVRVNSVHPGYVRTAMFDYAAESFGVSTADLGQACSPLGRVAEPEDVAAVVVLLASAESRHVTGAEIVVDGGATSSMGAA